MKIEHVAIWVKDLEAMRSFYARYFGGNPGPVYSNPAKRFTSCFLSFESGARLELMCSETVTEPACKPGENCYGYTHIAISAGSKERVDTLSAELVADGYELLDGPRTTGDGYYESVILDPEENRLEITV